MTTSLLTLLRDTAPPQSQGRATGIYRIYGNIGRSAGPTVGLQLGSTVGYEAIYLAVAKAMLLAAAPLRAGAARARNRGV